MLVLLVPAGAHARAGDLDPTFGRLGRTALALGAGDADVGGLAVRPDGRALLGATGLAGPRTPATIVTELAPGGAANAAFAATGAALVDPVLGARAAPAGLALAPDGSAIAVTTLWEPALRRRPAHLGRVLASGEPDRRFGVGGVARLTLPGGDVTAHDVALDDRGRILVAASTVRDGRRYMSAFRLLADGRLDHGFAADGQVDLNSRAAGGAILPRPGGGAYVAGGTLRAYGNIVVVEVDDRGRRLDRFAGGRAHVRLVDRTRRGSGARDMVFGPGGSLVVLASVRPAGGRERLAVARLTPRGRLDRRFGEGGVFRAGTATRPLIGRAIARDAYGRLLVAGSVRTPASGAEAALVLRLTPGGRTDRNFGRAGAVVQRLGGVPGARFVDSRATAISVARGRVWVGGVAYDDEVAPEGVRGRAWAAAMRLRN